MSSKREVFQLISLDFVCNQVNTYKGQFTTIIDAEIVSLVHRLIPWLKNSVEFQSTQISAKEMQFKVIALMNGMSGYIAEESEKKKDNSLRFVFGESDEGPVKLLNTGDSSWVDLEGSNPEIMLPIQLFILVRYYFYTHYYEPEVMSIYDSGVLIEKEVFLESLLDEIFIVANSAHILNKYKSIIKAKAAAPNNNINEFIIDFIVSLKKVVASPNFYLKEICFPCGFEGHFMYLTLLKFSTDRLVFRYDNLGPGCEKHPLNPTDQKPIPYILFDVNINELESTKEFFLMLCEQKFVTNPKEALEKLYGFPNLKMQATEVLEWNKGYRGLDKQMSGNCVFASLIIGMRYRWESYLGTSRDTVFLYIQDNMSVNTILSKNIMALGQGVNHADHIKNMRNEKLRQKQRKIKNKRYSNEPFENDRDVPMFVEDKFPLNNHNYNILINSRDRDYDPKYILDLEIRFLIEEEEKPDILNFFTPLQFKDGRVVNDLSELFVKNDSDKGNQFNRFFILGDTGCGKTILSKFIAYLWINEKSVKNYEWVLSYDLVVRISLRDVSQYLLSNTMDFEDLLKIVCFPQLDTHTIKAKIYNKKILVLLDGLDEVFSILRNNTSILDRSLLHKLIFNPKFTVLIFSRQVSTRYKPIDTLRSIRIQKFTYVNVVKYINKFIKHPNIQPKKVVETIYRHINLRTLIRNPLMLEIFCTLVNKGQITIDDSTLKTRLESSTLYRIALGIKLGTDDTEEFCYYFLSELAWMLRVDNTGVIGYGKFMELWNRLNFQHKNSILEFLITIGLITIFQGNHESESYVYLERTFQDYLSALYWSRMYKNDRDNALQKFESKNLDKIFMMTWKHSMPLLGENNANDFIRNLIVDSNNVENLGMLLTITVRLIYAMSELDLKNINTDIFNYAFSYLFSNLKQLYTTKYEKDVIVEAILQCPLLAITLLEKSYISLDKQPDIDQYWIIVNHFEIKVVSDTLIENIEKNSKFKRLSSDFFIYLSKSYISVLSERNQIMILDLLVKCFKAPLCVEICLNLSDNFLLGMNHVAFRDLFFHIFNHLKYNNQPHFYELLKALLKYAYIYNEHEIFCYFFEFFNEINHIETALFIAKDVLNDLMKENYLISFIENYLSKPENVSKINLRGFCKLIPFLEANENGVKILKDGTIVTNNHDNIDQPMLMEFKKSMSEAKYHEVVYSINRLPCQDEDTYCELILYCKANDPLELYFKIVVEQKNDGKEPVQNLEEILNMILDILKYYSVSHNQNLNFVKTADNQINIKLKDPSEVTWLVTSVDDNIQAWYSKWVKTYKNKCILM